MYLRNLLPSCLLGICLSGNSAIAADKCTGSVNVGAAYVHVDVLESGHTIKRLDMGGVKADASFLITKDMGFCIKPSALYVSGHGELTSFALGIGHVTPITEKLCITPSVGGTWTNLRTSVKLPIAPDVFLHAKERFRSLAPYVALDIHYTIMEGFRIYGCYQYSWSSTRTKINHIGNFKGNSKGPSYSLMLEKDLNQYWSVNAGAAYNVSLNHEKHGIRGYGFRLGVARWLY